MAQTPLQNQMQTQLQSGGQSLQQKQTLRPSPDALLNPRLDPIFKSLFTQRSEDSQKALESFLSAIFEKTVTNGKHIINTLIHPKKNAISQGANLKTAGSPATRQFALELYTLPL